jgi:outer membrane protein OmpA-like peptidoglycan-associated protein
MIRSFTLALCGASLLALSACQTGPSQRVITGAVAGAVVGAGVGMAAGGDDKRNAAIGAVAGAIAGGTVGGYMDKQERELREATAGTGIAVERVGDQIELTMPSNVTFKVNSADIQPGFTTSLDDVSKTLAAYPSTAVDIIGHASADGADDLNMKLSQRRADSVLGYLRTKGVNPVRMIATGMGETKPVAPNTDEAGRASNRRVEILLTPIVEQGAETAAPAAPR